MIKDKNIVIGVCGGIAAYKTLDIISKLKKLGANIDVVMTNSATKFIAPLSFQSLSQNIVICDMFKEPKSWEIQHISLAKKADLILIAPASANIIGKVSNGIADDMLSTTIMASKAPILFAPAMNTNMYENKIVQNNIEKLKSYGYNFIEPSSGRLACGDIGKGKLADVDDILDEVSNLLNDKKDYIGKKVLVTAGPTIEPIDPVRYITNKSSGKMGYAIAENASKRGAEVFLVSGPCNIKCSKNINLIKVNTNEEMYNLVLDLYKDCNLIIKAAAVADYKPIEYSNHKIKKNDEEIVLKLKKNKDILFELGLRKGNRVLVGFAAESENLINNALQKITKKNLDFIVANDITSDESGFKSDNNKACIIDKSGNIVDLPLMSKHMLADKILDMAIELL